MLVRMLLPLLLAVPLSANPTIGQGGLPDRPYSRPGPSDSQESGRLSPEGRQNVEDITQRIGSGRRVDLFDAIDRLMGSDARNAAEWISKLVSQAQGSGIEYRPGMERDLWKRYVSRFGGDPSGYSGLGRSSTEAGDFGSAVAAYSRAIELGAATPENFYGRGLAAERLGDMSLANEDAAMALRMDPSNAQAYSLFKLTQNAASTAKVDTLTGKVGLPAPGSAPAPEDLVVGAGTVGLPVVTPGKRTQAAGPIEISAGLTAAAQRHLQMKDLDAALEAAAKAIRLNPRNAKAYNLMATAYDKKGDHARAIAAANKALELDPDSVPALNTRAWAQSGLRRFGQALDDAGRILTLAPRSAFGYVNQGRALGGLDRRSEMLNALGRAALLDQRFNALRQAAGQLPADQDTELLFDGLLEGRAPAPGKRDKRSRFLRLLIYCAAGGGLFALGLLHVFSPRWRQTVSRTIGRIAGGAKTPVNDGEASSGEAGPIGSYDVKRVVGTGGMGVVYEAVDRGLDRRVAIKKMRGEIQKDPKFRKRFIDEARVVAKLRHPNIVHIHSILEEGEDLFLVFEFVAGQNLKEVLAAQGPLPFDQVLGVMRSVCDALSYAHGKGVIHRDLKLENLMADTEGTLRVMDFGLAGHAPEGGRTLAATIWGTPSYMAPEMENGTVLPQSDLYSLGICLYELVTGKAPFSGGAGAMFVAKSAGSYKPPSSLRKGLPAGLDAFVAKALAPDPAKRWSNAEEFWSAAKKLA